MVVVVVVVGGVVEWSGGENFKGGRGGGAGGYLYGSGIHTWSPIYHFPAFIEVSLLNHEVYTMADFAKGAIDLSKWGK